MDPANPPRSAILMISISADPETGVHDYRVMETLDPRHPGHVYHLTSREQEILGLLAAGKSNREIALHTAVSDTTVKRHVSNIFNKLAVNTRAMAVRRALEAGIL